MSRFGVRPIPSTMVRNHALHLTVVVVVLLAATAVVPSYGEYIRHVELKTNKNFSLPCDKNWVPVCAECSEKKRTFANYCIFYTARAKDDTCEFQHFDSCPYLCQDKTRKRKICSRKPDPLCARCGFEDLSFLNQCEYDNYQCLYGYPCEIKSRGYCETESGKIIYQKFHEKTKIHQDSIKKISIFDVKPPKE